MALCREIFPFPNIIHGVEVGQVKTSCLGAGTSHSQDYGEFPQQRPRVRGATAVAENSWATSIFYAQAMRGLFNLETDPERQAKYLDYIDIYADLDDNERKVYEQRYPEEVQKMTTFADRFIEKGIEKGIVEGKAQGQASVLLKQLQIRFGGVDSQYRQRIEQADTDTLLLWAERILTADSLEDVFI